MRVPLTNQLRHDIRQNARYALQAPVTLAEATKQEAASAIYKHAQQHTTQRQLVEFFWGSNLHLHDAGFPADWGRNMSRVVLSYDAPNLRPISMPVSDFPTGDPNVAPSKTLLAPPDTSYNQAYPVPEGLVPDELTQAYTAACEEVYRARDTQSTLATDISAVLSAHSSVNNLIKAYPELKTFVPEQALQKMDMPAPTRTKAEPKRDVTLDTNTLAASLAIHELTR